MPFSPYANPYVQIKSHSFNHTHLFSYQLRCDSCANLYHKKITSSSSMPPYEQNEAHMMNENLIFPLLFSLSHRRHSSNNIAHTKESVLMKTWVSYHWELVRETLKVVKIERESEENCCETKSKVKQKKGRKHKRKLR